MNPPQNRSMFNSGNVNNDNASYKKPNENKTKTLPMYEGHVNQLGKPDENGNIQSNITLSQGSRNLDPGFANFLDRYGIDEQTYAFIHEQAGNPIRFIDDGGVQAVTPGLDLFMGGGILKGIGNALLKKGTQGTGKYVAETLPFSVAGPTRGFQEITENVTKLTPLGKGVTTVAATTALAAPTFLPDDDNEEDLPFTAINQNDVQTEIDLLESKNKKDLENKKKKADNDRIKKEIKNIEDVINMIQGFDTKQSEAYQQQKKEKTGRNANIFLEEMALSMAGTNNLADGLAIGAANAASKVGDADEAEELAYAKFLKEEEEKNTPKELKETTVMNVIKDYGEQVGALEGSLLLNGKIVELKEMLLDPSKNISGLGGFFQGVRAQFQGAFGQDGTLLDRSKAVGIVKFLQARMVQDLLDEKGKTISDADRALIKELLGNLESTVSNRADIIELLNNVTSNLNNSIKEQRRYIKIYDRRYSGRIPELDEMKLEFNYVPTADIVENNEVSIANDPTVIQ